MAGQLQPQRPHPQRVLSLQVLEEVLRARLSEALHAELLTRSEHVRETIFCDLDMSNVDIVQDSAKRRSVHLGHRHHFPPRHSRRTRAPNRCVLAPFRGRPFGLFRTPCCSSSSHRLLHHRSELRRYCSEDCGVCWHTDAVRGEEMDVAEGVGRTQRLQALEHHLQVPVGPEVQDVLCALLRLVSPFRSLPPLQPHHALWRWLSLLLVLVLVLVLIIRKLLLVFVQHVVLVLVVRILVLII
mmetsp:Transcript_8673/g.19856  ORF Transcript_8673/g.19856 Transcript_8673/m.19856 type:complete len:241 (+) Transcript_8673:1527-2249(+)